MGLAASCSGSADSGDEANFAVDCYTSAALPSQVPTATVAAWNPALPPWPVAYTDAQKSTQRTVGAQMVSNLQNAANAGQHSYTIAPGVYRISQAILLQNTNDFTINANNVEIIAEQGAAHFLLFSNSNMTVNGTLTLDGDPFGMSQGRIVNTDHNTFIDVAIMPGYPAPAAGFRVMFFDPNGTMLPHFQDATQNVTLLSANSNVYRIAMNPLTFALYPQAISTVIKAGNYMTFENPPMANGGFTMRYNRGLTFNDINFYTSALIWALPEYGEDRFVRWKGIRRPATNRLGAGGWMQMAFHGGGFSLIDSEISYNYDDLTDIFSPLAMAYGPLAANTLIMSDIEGGPRVGETLVLYNLDTLHKDGSAVITAIAPIADTNVLSAAQALGKGAQCLFSWGCHRRDIGQQCSVHWLANRRQSPGKNDPHHHDRFVLARRPGRWLQWQGRCQRGVSKQQR